MLKPVKRIYNGKYAVGFRLSDGNAISDAEVVAFLSRGNRIFGLSLKGQKITGADGIKLSDLLIEKLSNTIEQPQKIKLISKLAKKTSRGALSKCWYNIDGKKCLVKGNSIDDTGVFAYEPYSEVLASRILYALGFKVVMYYLADAKLFPDVSVYGIKHVSVCENYANESITATPFSKYIDFEEGQDVHDYWMTLTTKYKHLLRDTALMLVCDAFIGNRDRHLNNWDILKRINSTEVKVGPFMDFGASLLSWNRDSEIKAYLSNGRYIGGMNDAKPFHDTHKKQYENIIGCCDLSIAGFDIEVAKQKIRDVIKKGEDVFSKMNSDRSKAIKKYIEERFKYLGAFI
jgi:hypothetical protein